MERPSLDSFILSPIQRKTRKKLDSEVLFENLRGDDGKDGVSVSTAGVNDDGDLILTLSNGKEVNAGHVQGEDGENGEDGDTPEIDIVDIVNRVLALIPEPEPIDTETLKEEIVSSLPQKTAQDFLAEIQELGLKLPLSVLEDFEKVIESAKKESKDHTDKKVGAIRMTGGNTNIRLKNGGSPVGQVETINFIGGTMTAVGDGREVNITFPGGGGAFYNDTVAGTIDGVNTVFTVTNTIVTAIFLSLGNSNYQVGVDYTVTGTKQITLTTAPDSSLSGQPFFLVHT